MRPDFEIAETKIKAGTREVVRLPLPGMYTHTPLWMPIHVAHGKKDGPTIFISAAIHGDEINGVEIIRRVLSLSSLKRLSGTILAVPIVNVLGFNNHSRYLPDRRDLNRSFPGRELGTLAGRMANTFMSQVVMRSDLGIDLHTAAIHRDNFPQIRADLNNEKIAPLAKAFGTPVLLHSAAPEGTLRAAAAHESVSVMVYESGEALRFDEVSIRVGVSGIINVLRQLGMLPIPKKTKPPRLAALLRSSAWVRAPQSGILRAQIKLGGMVSKGEQLGIIADPTGHMDEPIIAPFDGIIIGRTNIPLVYEGEALYHIGRTHQTSLLEQHLDGLQDSEMLEAPELIEEPAIV
jgi:uncharacterized protein